MECDRAIVFQKTANSDLSFAEVISNSHCGGLRSSGIDESDEKIEFKYEADIMQTRDDEFVFDKFICFYTSIEEDVSMLVEKAVGEIVNAEREGAALIIDEHKVSVKKFWENG